MPQANFVVIRVMRRGDFYSACAKGHVYNNSIGDNRQAAVNEGMFGKSSVKMLYKTLLNVHFDENGYTLYRGSSGCTAIAESPNIVSGRVVATIIFSSTVV